MSETKKCSKCGEEKSILSFHKDKSKRDGLHTCCKDCFSEIGKSYRLKIKNSNKKIILTKKCSSCKCVLDSIKFGKNSSSIDGLQSTCKSCRSIYIKNNKEKIYKYLNVYRKNSDKYKSNRNNWLNNNRDKVNCQKRRYNLSHQEIGIKMNAKEYFKNIGIQDVSNELINLKINQIKLIRKIKEAKKNG